MKVVKSSNKRRGRNITVGTVVGFLLSCTAVMGVTGDNYLWIKKDSGEIKFSIDNNTTPFSTENPYDENTWNRIDYINNITLSGTNNLSGSEGYGLRLSEDLGNFNFINNGVITGTGDSLGYGIYNESGSITTLVNSGLMTGTGYDVGSGVYNEGGSITNLVNSGLMSGTGTEEGTGIYNSDNGSIGTLTNSGLITGTGKVEGSGIYNYYSNITNLVNSGLISGTGDTDGFGIYNSEGSVGTLTNSGLITGTGDNGGSGIYNERGSIGTLTNSGLITGTGDTDGTGIYNPDGNIGTLTNSGLITGTGDTDGTGISNYDGSIVTLTNSGLITGTGNGSSSGIYNESGSIGTLTNSGLITGTGNNTCYGIYNESGNITTLVNSGLITGTGEDMSYGIYNSGSITNLVNSELISGTGELDGYGIYNYDDNIGTLTNRGLIIGTGDNGGYGIYNYDGSITTLVNRGLIIGTGDSGGYGIYNGKGIETLTNTGVIYGKDNAIKNESGTITTAKNYGILVNGDDGKEVVDGLTVVNSASTKNQILNKGLIFKALDGGGYKAGEEDYKKFGETFDNDAGITIINAKALGNDKDDITGTESLKLENGTLSYNDSKDNHKEEKISSNERYILNGITNTLEVSGKNNELNDSIINAYETAVVMNGKESMLTLNNTVVNGGLSGENTVKIEGDGNTLNVQGNSVINGVGTAITVTGDNNALVLEGNVVVNGKMESTGNNILSLNGNAEDGMNIYHDISGFINMNIENNVTFFEDVKVTGTETVTVDKDGVLNLRLKKDTTTYSTIPTAVHAFSGTDSTTIKGASEGEAGTLNFITNGIGKEIYVNMENIELENMKVRANSIIDKVEISDKYIHLGAGSDLSGIVNPKVSKYDSLDGIYKSLYSSTDENLDALRDILSMTYLGKNYDYNNATDEEQLKTLMSYLDSIYTGTPYSYSSELSRKSMGMFRDIITDNQFRPDLNRWLVMGGLTHTDGGTKDSYYGQNYHGIDTGTADVDVDMKLTGAYALGKYGYSENVALGVTVGGNKSEAKLPMSKVKGNSGYIGAFAENYRGNLTLKAGAGIQYSEYDANRATLGGHSYSDKYSDMTYDIYLNGRYSHNIGNNLFLEPYGTLSYTYIKQDSADEGNKVLAIETDSKSFDYTAAKVGVDIKKVIPHEKGKSTLSAGVSYTRLLTGADEENITGRFKGGSDFDILVAHKNEQSIGLNAKYALELENGILFDVKGSYSLERDSHNGTGKNRNKGEWIIGAGLGYKF
ncbi:autotransporter outer membrane beta-barrel domain-containing protein [Fusobacterium varium]|nr:autotransporter outer membrane beta-barrel domain-containing protein [Fusobacterium varium]